ncbi:bifunctional molybdenum cofactor biosynthesis protein MoaC/MoaB [Salinisphaera sp. Q1T1-3]|uniref:bifunctional molybdenum cofactor biosynthesis protein MoaC/MoaB n=1 Tax=Salinisphaera sp. Q1T1-3 TaxID=2321229 RepID=UPI000E76A92B|nr:bifunctional molybdenum cofactor biosynthesis protein MoaC/MoaB [Salinisphaera sp. Q1T1-3]RJS94803.1 bifunctional molybdenum cofactor biosynthesis protein MoaC/MoaB [Salinisphaera sp. Q1T1-3]
MKNVGMKPDTLRSATAAARFYAPAHCLARIAERDTEKGDPQASARIAGILAAKRTDELLPLCHPLPIHAAEVHFEIADDHVAIRAEVHTIGPTGVEMEALTAASMAALTLYDMLKPYAEPDELAIGDTQLLDKTGGKSDHSRRLAEPLGAAVYMVSNPAADGAKSDAAGRNTADALVSAGFAPLDYQVLREEPEALAQTLDDAVAAHTPLVITVGGTGIGPRDQVVETIEPRLTTPMPGLMETARAFGQKRSPYAVMSRGVAGFIGHTLVVTFPGSRRGADETMAALLPSLIHILEIHARFTADKPA